MFFLLLFLILFSSYPHCSGLRSGFAAPCLYCWPLNLHSVRASACQLTTFLDCRSKGGHPQNRRHPPSTQGAPCISPAGLSASERHTCSTCTQCLVSDCYFWEPSPPPPRLPRGGETGNALLESGILNFYFLSSEWPRPMLPLYS